MVVGDDLHLDVPWPGEKPLDVHVRPPERRLRFALGGGQQLGDLAWPGDDAHAPTATAVDGLDGQGPAQLVAELADGVGFVDGEHRSRDWRHAGVAGDLSGRQLVAHHCDDRSRGPDPRQRCIGHGAGEVGSLSQEPVAGVDRVATRLHARADDAIDVEIGLGGTRSGEGDGTVSELHRHRVGVRLAVHDHGLDAESMARRDNANGDLATIRDEHPGDHRAAFTPGKLAHVRDVPKHGNHPFTELTHCRSAIRAERGSERDVGCASGDEPAASLDDGLGSAAHPQLHHWRRDSGGGLGRVDVAQVDQRRRVESDPSEHARRE